MASEIAKAYVQIIPSAEGISGNIEKVLGGEADKAGSSSGKKFSSSFAGAIGTVGKVAAGAVAAGTTAVGAFAKASIDAGAQFDSSMSQVAATMGVTVDEIGNLRDFAMEMGSKTAFSATEAADALNYMALAGYDAETSMQMLPNVLNLAAAGGMDLASASDMITDSQSALGLTLEETSTLVDQMAAASSKSNTSVSQLGEAILKIGGTAKTLSGGTTELSTALGILADNGTKGAEGGTALRNIMLSLQAPTDKAAKAMDALGITAFDAEGNMRPLQEIFEDFNTVLADASDAERTNVLNDIFNKVDLKNVNALMDTNVERWQELSSAIDDSKGASEQMANTQLDNLTGDITLFQSALEGAKIAVSDGLTPSLREFVQFGSDGLSRITDAFKEGGISGAMSELGTIISDAVSMITEKAPEIVNAGMELLQALGEGLLSNIGIITDAAFEIVQNLAEKILAPGTLSSILQAGFDIIVQLGTGLSNALPTLIPMAVQVVLDLVNTILENIPLLVSVANDLVVGLMDGIFQALPILIGSLPDLITNVINALLQSLPILIQGTIQLVTGLVQHLPEIVQALIEAAPQLLFGIVGALVENTPILIEAFYQLFSAVADALPAITLVLIESLPQSFVEIGNAFMGLLPILVDTFNQVMVQLAPTFSQIGQFAQEAWAAIQQTFSNVGTWFKSKFQSAVNGIKSAFNTIKSYFQNLWNQIKQVFSDAVSQFTSVGSAISNGILKGLSSSWANLKAFLQKACGDLIALAKRILGIASPSKEFAKEVGQWIPAGIALGIKNGMGVLNNEIQKMTDEALVGTITASTEAVNSVNFVPDASSISEGSSVVINNNITVDGATDPEAWTQTFISTLKREARMA